MSKFDIIPLLIHSDDVPHDAKVALKAAQDTPDEEQKMPLLETAANALYWETELGCGEVRELVGLDPDECG